MKSEPFWNDLLPFIHSTQMNGVRRRFICEIFDCKHKTSKMNTYHLTPLNFFFFDWKCIPFCLPILHPIIMLWISLFEKDHSDVFIQQRTKLTGTQTHKQHIHMQTLDRECNKTSAGVDRMWIAHTIDIDSIASTIPNEQCDNDAYRIARTYRIHTRLHTHKHTSIHYI